MYVINNCKLVSLASNVGEENIRTNTYKFKETIISVKKKRKEFKSLTHKIVYVIPMLDKENFVTC
jgi:hypothetical protein